MNLYIVRTITGKKNVVQAYTMSEALGKIHGIPTSVDVVPKHLEIIFKPYLITTI